MLFHRLPFLIRQIIRKECDSNWTQLETSPTRNWPSWKWAMCTHTHTPLLWCDGAVHTKSQFSSYDPEHLHWIVEHTVNWQDSEMLIQISLSVSLSLYIYTHIIYIYTHVCIYIYIYIYTHVYTYIYIYTHTIHTYIYIYTYTYIHTYVYIQINMCTHAACAHAGTDPSCRPEHRMGSTGTYC